MAVRVPYYIYACDVCGVMRAIPVVADQKNIPDEQACNLVSDNHAESDACNGVVRYLGSAVIELTLSPEQRAKRA